jgi:hypothetical protein
MGKGSRQRPRHVSYSRFATNWERALGPSEPPGCTRVKITIGTIQPQPKSGTEPDANAQE